ncbi:hypothetical protein A3B45_04715 [Candidatus Daviesbacteria bacterium RIFCSPLOWO2_01_FULL_39_12]|uniref:Thioredoxin-like fold domain-containing protein n=1 Tax=Candidatus Daviesbacteria bacterium RIFCSPLOWO2_01_FULL_39_12 TaxID=1797785 RepID=A0A1F5KM22_9BACT|nr:MAG: hypothetical protein A3B45_04715 [Candidatus Daviesbacteria bacterium RIFCSPLOWO2_01_FULL_39_12]
MNRKYVVSSIVSNISWPKIILTVILAATVIGTLVATKTLAAINRDIAAAKEAARPANVRLIKIITPNCQDCFNVELAVNDFKKQNVKVEEEKTLNFDSPEAGASIKQLAIKKVPTYFVTGEVTKNNLENFVKESGEIRDNTFIFTKLSPIFVDTETKREMGRVIVTLITDPLCSKCTDVKIVVENFKKAGVKVREIREFSWNSYDGQSVISQYRITKVPTFIFSSEFDLYDSAKSTWQNFGTVENDKTYVTRNLPLPYRDLTKGQLVGFVDLIYLTDASCIDCYKAPDVQKPILTQGYGVALRSERTVDIFSGEGQSLISKYKIIKIPTILISPEANQYTNLKNVWKNVGTVEQDGWFVFRELQQLKGVVYKDLTTNQIVGRVQSATPSATPSGVKQ